jgi:arabinofuranosyltransferase
MPAMRSSAATREGSTHPCAPGRPATAGAPPGWRPLGLVAGVCLGASLGLFLVHEHRIAGTVGFPLDDSWIHLHFARNLAEGAGFSYNPGVPVSGSTAPLWTLLLGAAFAVAGPGLLWVKGLGGLAMVGAAVLAGRLTWAWTGHRGLALAATAGVSLSAPAAWGALSGMEVALAAFLVTAAVLCHAAGHPAGSAACLALAVLARPEAAILVPLVWLAGPQSLRRTALFVGAALLFLGPWVGFNLAAGGSALPATAAAKVEGGLLGLGVGVRESMGAALARPPEFAASWAAWLFGVSPVLPLLIPVGLGVLWLRHGRAAGLPALVLLLHPLGMALVAPYRGPDFQEGRYSIHLLPLAVAAAVAGLGGDRFTPLVLRRIGATLLVAGTLAGLWPAAARYGWAVQNIDAMQVHLGRWVAAHTPVESRIGLNDVGAIAYFSRREIVDLMGLMTPEIIPYRRHGEAGVRRYLERACPDYLVIFPAWFPDLARLASHVRPLYRVRLQRNEVAGAAEMVVYETAWNRWAPAPRPCPGGAGEAPAGRV